MSTLTVEVCEVAAVERHPDALQLAIARVKGWQTCIKYDPDKGTAEFATGDLCVYFPPDAVLPEALADRLGVINYLAPLPKNADGTRPPGYRVRAARLRGVPSYGLIIPITDNPAWVAGDDVTDFYGITKYEPRLPANPEAIPNPPVFHHYTEIEPLGNFPDVLMPGEEVVVTEKIHGMNCRAGLINLNPTLEEPAWSFVAGSYSLNLRQYNDEGRLSDFWQPLDSGLRALLQELSQSRHSVVAFGEIFGPGVLDMKYGQTGVSYRLFDIAVDRVYLDYDRKAELCEKHGVAMVPVLWRGPFSYAKIAELTNGPTTLCPPEQAGKFKGREGIVITPARERADIDSLGSENSRVIFKSVSVDYLARKGGKDAR